MSPKGIEGLRILVVDDERGTRELLKSLLQEMGAADVFRAANGDEALEAVVLQNPDLILCDLLMETMDGIEFTRRVRTSRQVPNVSVPIVLVTAYTDRQTVIEARDAGVNAFLAKPVSINELTKKANLVLADPRQFITSDDYVGPDRRRRNQPLGGRKDRRRTET